MRWVLVAFMVVLALGFAAEAGGKGATKLTLYEGTYDDVNYPSPRVVLPSDPADWVEAGHVLVTSTGSGKVEVTVKLESDDPDAANETFNVSIVPRGPWGTDVYELTSNKKGQGTVHIQRDTPDADPLRFKVSLVTADGQVAFATELVTVEFK